MLQAINEQGKRVIPAIISANDINQLKQTSQRFICPVCKEQVRLRLGTKRIPHFSHIKTAGCPNHVGGEGIYHEQGKLQLFNWLKKQGYIVDIEVYLKQIKQRADLLMNYGNRMIAIEYQCAKITTQEIIKRTKGYQSVGIIPIWILGSGQMNRQGKTILKLTPTLQHYLHQYPSNDFARLLFYCPHTNKIASFDLISFVTSYRALGKFHFLKLSQLQFPHLFKQGVIDPVPNQWLIEKKRFRLSSPKLGYGRESAFYQWLYLNQLNPSQLSSWVGLPVSSQWLVKGSVWDWQARLCYDFFNKQINFTDQELAHFAKPYLQSSRDYPLILKDVNPIRTYLNYFIMSNLITYNGNYYMLTKQIGRYKCVEQSLHNDQRLHIKLKRYMRSKM
ncbi:competence protein CoiA [Amphibacillus cookii]|uniref:competence protein CoiA n=1 Tax=Amphibacillus cookii TaxID=767787 RepID=UPI001957105C|nr:competence protein CoiA family protein [Amphibacillus cookii]MBM7540171.1 competence CoiA-like predicted nuclease [Amphibacillus cookii]